VLLADISEPVACIKVAAQSGIWGSGSMSAALSTQGELASSSDLAKVDTVLSSVQTKKLEFGDTAVKAVPATYRPVRGLVGHCFIRACLLFDLATSWKRRAYITPEGGFSTFAAPVVADRKSAPTTISNCSSLARLNAPEPAGVPTAKSLPSGPRASLQ
jgi:hypothetical protein